MPIVRFFAGLRSAAGTKETTLPASSLQELLDALVAAYPALQEKLWDGRALRPHIVITINGQHLDPAGGLAVPLGPEDQVAIFPPIAGG